LDGPDGVIFRRIGKIARAVHQTGVEGHLNVEAMMGTSTAELPGTPAAKPHLTVVRAEVAQPTPRLDFVDALDLLGQSIGVFTLSGTLLHRTDAFRTCVERPAISAAVSTVVTTMATQAENTWRRHTIPSPVSCRAGDSVVRASLFQPSDEPMVLICIEAMAITQGPTDQEVIARFGLSPAELRVARRLVSGESNKAIAFALDISEHTARHHTQRVLRKLGLNSRAAILSTLISFAG
jgi:DNA-binding CsgD family transcriptional regulator